MDTDELLSVDDRALHYRLEGGNIGGLNDGVEDSSGVDVSADDLVRQIALQTARVVIEGVACWCSVPRSAGRVEGDGAEVDLHVLEGAGCDAPTA